MKIQKTFYLKIEQVQKLQAVCHTKGISESEIMRNALDEYLQGIAGENKCEGE